MCACKNQSDRDLWWVIKQCADKFAKWRKDIRLGLHGSRYIKAGSHKGSDEGAHPKIVWSGHSTYFIAIANALHGKGANAQWIRCSCWSPDCLGRILQFFGYCNSLLHIFFAKRCKCKNAKQPAGAKSLWSWQEIAFLRYTLSFANAKPYNRYQSNLQVLISWDGLGRILQLSLEHIWLALCTMLVVYHGTISTKGI